MSGLIAIVVLSWNAREETIACLRSLQTLTHDPVTVVVVDNGSSDGTNEAIRSEYPQVELVVNERNLGFPGGVNGGIARARQLGAEAVVLLNNDTQVDPGFVTALVAEAGRSPSAAALCSKVYFAEPSDRIWFFGARYDPRRGYQGRQTGYGDRDGPAYSTVQRVDRMCAASVLLPLWALDAVGPLDESYFFYGEDVDWSLRARVHGYEIVVVPDSRVWHAVSAAIGGEGSAAGLFYATRNGLRVAEQYAPLGWLRTWRRRCVLVGACVAQALLAGRGRGRRILAAFRGLRAGLAGETGPDPRYSPDAMPKGGVLPRRARPRHVRRSL